MVYVQTMLRVSDNTGGFYAMCIKVISNSKLAMPGNTVVVSIKSVLLNKKLTHQKKKKILKGAVRKAVLLRNGHFKKRWGNIIIKSKNNSVAMIGQWDMPLGNRVDGPVSFEVRVTKYLKIAMLSEGYF